MKLNTKRKEAICNECQHLIFIDAIYEENNENTKKDLSKKECLMKR